MVLFGATPFVPGQGTISPFSDPLIEVRKKAGATNRKMSPVQRVAFLLLAALPLAEAHPQPVENEEGCTCEPGARPFESYHIHVMFYPDGVEQFSNNTHSSKFARSLRKAFIDHFKVPQCEGDIFNQTTLCAFAVDATGAGGPRNAAPFVAPNFAIFVPHS